MIFHRSQSLAVVTRIIYAGLMAIILGGVVQAEPAEGGRWLLAFDTSATMKKRWSATLEAANHFLAAGADGQLQPGDSLAIWTYGRQISAGQFPLATWDPEHATLLGSNLVRMLRNQPFTNTSSLATLQSPLNRLITSSERLTVVIFCDGLSPINFTPYDEGINQNFSDGQAERKKSQQPFVLVLRSQLGKFIGCTVSFPPSNINVPSFPPLPTYAPITRSNVTTSSQSPTTIAPKATVPDLVIVGKKVGTNDVVAAEAVAPTPKVVVPPPTIPAPTVPPPVKVATTPVPPAAKPIVAPVVMAVTQVVVKPVAPVVTQVVPALVAAPITTNAQAVAAPVADEGHTRMFIFIGVGLLAVAIGLVLVIVHASRRPHASLITSTMNDDPRRK